MEKKATLHLTPTLPGSLIEVILLRLPVRCLLLFKCVSKSWLSLISDPQFAKSHFDLAVAPTHRLLLKVCNDSEAISVDTEASLDDHDSVKVVLNVPNPILEQGWRAYVVNSCRGFILLTTATCDFNYFIIWNPSTGFKRRFKQASLVCPYLCGIGYDSSSDDYVVVTLAFPPPRISGALDTTVIHCFSSRNNSWSCTDVTVPYMQMRDDFEYGLLLNKALHWLVYSFGDYHYKIIAFDVMERSLVEIPLPSELEDHLCHLRVMGGCLCLCVDKPEQVEMWIMKEYKVHSSWTKSSVFSNLYPFDNFLPICFTKNGEILGHNRRKTLMRLNDKGERLQHCCAGLSIHKYGLLHYRESLLSLPADFEKLTE